MIKRFNGIPYLFGLILSGMALGAATGPHPNVVLSAVCVVLAGIWLYLTTFQEEL